MAYISNVNHVVNLVAIHFEYTSKYIFEHVRTQIADVRVVVDGGPATVESRFAISDRFKLARLAGVGVIQSDCHVGLYCVQAL